MAETTANTVKATVEAIAADHGHGDHHGPVLGRPLNHPPEPPHLLQIWYKKEQKALAAQYVKDNPGSEKPDVVEHWLQSKNGHLVKDANGNYVPVEGASPTLPQILHVGTLRKELPLIGYAPWENHVFLGLSLILLTLLFVGAASAVRGDRRKAMRRPTRWQMLIEMVVGGFEGFCRGVLGDKHGRTYMPFIGTLFCLILISNLLGLIPLMRAPTASIVITFSLALCTFIVVQSTAWLKLGPLTYIHHLMGSPRDFLGWALSPLFLVLEVISDFVAKPMSLALRLFGNIFGKDILLGAFMVMGIQLVGVMAGPLGDYIGVPLTVPFYFLGLLLSAIQALVFALLSMIYIMLVLPHDHDHDHEHDHAEGHDHGHHREEVHEAVPA